MSTGGKLTVTNRSSGKDSRQIVVNIKPMSMPEKSRIEKLVDTRAEALTGFLTEMKTFAFEANESMEFEGADEVLELTKELALLGIERERIDGRKSSEHKVVEQVLSDNKDRKLERLKQIERTIQTKFHKEMHAANAVIDEKYRKEEDALVNRKTEIDARIARLAEQAKRQKLVRKVALSNSFSKLEDGITDSRNRAVEKLYTEVVEPTQAAGVLAHLPDAATFRAQVSPEKLFQLFNDSMRPLALTLADKAVCKKCGKDNLMQNPRGEMYCRSCGTIDVLSPEIKNLVALPTLEEIVQSTRPVTSLMPTAGLEVTVDLPEMDLLDEAIEHALEESESSEVEAESVG